MTYNVLSGTLTLYTTTITDMLNTSLIKINHNMHIL